MQCVCDVCNVSNVCNVGNAWNDGVCNTMDAIHVMYEGTHVRLYVRMTA